MTYRVDDAGANVVSFQRIGNNLDRLSRGQHTCETSVSSRFAHSYRYLLTQTRTGLDNINPNIFTNSIDLLPHKARGGVMYVLHTQGILCCQCGGSSHSIAAMRRNHLLISL